MFFVNLPLGILALVFLLVWFPGTVNAPADEQPARIDVRGSLCIAAATIALLIGLTLVGEGSRTWGSRLVQNTLGLAALLFATVVLVERRAPEPVLSLDLFRRRTFAANAALTFFLWMALFGAAFYIPLLLQGVLGVSPTTAGLAMTPFSLSIVAGNFLAGVVIARLGHYQPVVVAGALLMAGGAGLLAYMVLSASLASVTVLAALTAFGIGILFTVTAVVVQRTLTPASMGAGFAAAERKEMGVLGRFFAKLRLALAVALQRGLVAVLLFSMAALGTAFLVTDTGRRGPI